MKVVYILSNHGKNKNYVKKMFGNGATFTRDKEEALTFDREGSINMRRMLMNSIGNAYVEEANEL